MNLFIKGLQTFKMKKSLAFTLAEVLITLGVIGVVAALTIPILQNSYEEQEYNSGIYKIYSSLSNALKLILMNNNGTIDVNSSHNNLRSEFANVMNFIKVGTENQIFLDKSNTVIQYQYYKSPACKWPAYGGATSAATLSDGSYIGFYSNADCNWGGAGSNVCSLIVTDINGARGPNTHGKDLFFFYVMKKNNVYSIEPGGSDGKVCSYGSCNIGQQYGCAKARLTNTWS